MSLEQQIQAAYQESFGTPATAEQLNYWQTFFMQPVQILHYGDGGTGTSPQRYADLIQWNKDYMAKAEGKPTRINVITKSYQDSVLKKTPTQTEIDYWLGKPVFTYKELLQFAADYVSDLGTVAQQVRDSYDEAIGLPPTAAEVSYWNGQLDTTQSLDHYKAVGADRRYSDLIQWHKDYMGTQAGQPTRRDVIVRSYENGALHKTPSESEINYWFGQPVYTYKELLQFAEDYIDSAKPGVLNIAYGWSADGPAPYKQIVTFVGKWTSGSGQEGDASFTHTYENDQQLFNSLSFQIGNLKKGMWTVTATVLDGYGLSPATCSNVNVNGSINFDTANAPNYCRQ